MPDIESPDGRPVIHPTRRRVEAMCDATRYAAATEIGPFPLSENVATVETIAVNAVMAGCEPAQFPVVLAALQASLADKFNLYGILATTEPHWPAIVVSGPIVDEVGLNSGANALGQGTRANATIGRALTLTYMTVADARPGVTDKATHGGPHKFGLCIAENAAKNPWDSFHVTRGYCENENTVTVVGIEAPHNISDCVADTAAGVLTTIAGTMTVLGANTTYLTERSEPFVVLSPDHAQLVADDGWSKTDVRHFLYEQAQVPLAEAKYHGMYDAESGGHSRHVPVADLPADARIPLCSGPDEIMLSVAGGAGRHSLFLSSFGDTRAVTRPIR